MTRSSRTRAQTPARPTDAPVRVYEVAVDGRIVDTLLSRSAAIRVAMRHRIGDSDAEWTVTEVAA